MPEACDAAGAFANAMLKPLALTADTYGSSAAVAPVSDVSMTSGVFR